jgi:hypothetical protein
MNKPVVQVGVNKNSVSDSRIPSSVRKLLTVRTCADCGRETYYTAETLSNTMTMTAAAGRELILTCLDCEQKHIADNMIVAAISNDYMNQEMRRHQAGMN